LIEYKVISGSKFERQLKKLPKEVGSFITEISEVQKNNPFPEEYDLKKMKGFKNLWRVRFNTKYGSFRHVFEVDSSNKMILQKSVVLRKDVY
jgi:mRNA-degrading endonuclease RelE of RelBE toxin-antitoxin system